MKEMVTVGKVLSSQDERIAFDVITLRQRAAQGKKPDDYLDGAASCAAKAIINSITDDVDEKCIARGCIQKNMPIQLRLTKHEEVIGDNIYRCWYDVAWESKDGDIPQTVIELKKRFGYVFGYAATYFSEELVMALVDSLSGILGKPKAEKTKSAKTYLWNYGVM